LGPGSEEFPRESVWEITSRAPRYLVKCNGKLDRQLAMDAVQEAFLLLLSPRVPFQVHSTELFRPWLW
jgi:hypothetical protein